MALFMDVHSGMSGMTQDQLLEAHKKDQAIEKEVGVHFIKAWADPSSGKCFCLSEAPNKEAVLQTHERAGHPAGEIYPVPLSIE